MTTQSERSLAGQIGAAVKWSRVKDYTAATAPARAGFERRFEREVDPDGTLPPAQRQRMAEHARRAYFLRLAAKSAQARKARARANDLEAAVVAELESAAGGAA